LAQSRTALQQTWDLVCTCFRAHTETPPWPPIVARHRPSTVRRWTYEMLQPWHLKHAGCQLLPSAWRHSPITALAQPAHVAETGICPAAPETVGLRQSVAGTINDAHWVGYPKLGRPLSLAGGDSVALHDPFFTARETCEQLQIFQFPRHAQTPKRGVCFPSRHACSGAMCPQQPATVDEHAVSRYARTEPTCSQQGGRAECCAAVEIPTAASTGHTTTGAGASLIVYVRTD
jgi:hypothetical protein